MEFEFSKDEIDNLFEIDARSSNRTFTFMTLQ